MRAKGLRVWVRQLEGLLRMEGRMGFRAFRVFALGVQGFRLWCGVKVFS